MNCLGDAQGQQEQHHNSQKIVRKAGRQSVIFANNFSSFLQAYSGVIEIMKGADQQYGGVAYSTLSLFLIVCQALKIAMTAADRFRSPSTSKIKRSESTQLYLLCKGSLGGSRSCRTSIQAM